MAYNNFEVEITFSIKSYNIDAAGHVNNAVYINWLEDLRANLLEKILPIETISNRNFHFVVASTNIEYKKPLHLYEKPVGKMKVDKYEKGIWYLSGVIKLNDKVITRAFQKCVLIDKMTQKMVKDKAIRDLIK
jgi:acyl-CoA thioester hydrolase